MNVSEESSNISALHCPLSPPLPGLPCSQGSSLMEFRAFPFVSQLTKKMACNFWELAACQWKKKKIKKIDLVSFSCKNKKIKNKSPVMTARGEDKEKKVTVFLGAAGVWYLL